MKSTRWKSVAVVAGLTVATAVLGLFESSHMEYEYDRPSDLGGEPSLKDMTVKAHR